MHKHGIKLVITCLQNRIIYQIMPLMLLVVLLYFLYEFVEYEYFIHMEYIFCTRELGGEIFFTER